VKRFVSAGFFFLLTACTAAAAQVPPAQVSTSIRALHSGQVVDGVPCLGADLPVQHIHVHLQILADGVAVAVPAGIGVGRPWGIDPGGFIATGSCFAWLHTHDTTGIVHIVSPEETTFRLGQLFSVWGQPLQANGALGYRGSLKLLIDGKAFSGDPRTVPLVNLQNLVLELGRPPATRPPASYDFAALRR
jgi:hypothetical protein